MRSLFVDDIPGAKPKRHYFDKAIYRQRHEQQIIRFAKRSPDQKRVIEWYRPINKVTEPLERTDDDHFRTKLTLKRSFMLEDKQKKDMSKSIQLNQKRSKSMLINQSEIVKSNILEGTGRKSLGFSSFVNEDPYFPHRYVDKISGQANKWSGSRDWESTATKMINLPSPREGYFKKF